jgi:inward rectifier potassium channel
MRKSKQNSTGNLVEKEQQRQDLGFGTNTIHTNTRMIRSDGTINVRRIGQSFEAKLNLYHRLITMHWLMLVAVVFLSYLFINFFFAGIYYYIGTEHLVGMKSTEPLSAFGDAFFFSSQTLTTVGYGHISPSGILTNIVASVEALVGLMLFAIITGLLYGRFSRPNPKVLFSKNALIAPYLDTNALMFRLVNEKSNQIVNLSANVTFSRNETNEAGKIVRKYYNLPLERSLVRLFPMSWTIVHAITDESPLFNETQESLAADDTEIIITLDGINDTYADQIFIRHSYLYSEFVWGAKFVDMMLTDNEQYQIDLSMLSDFEKVALNN